MESSGALNPQEVFNNNNNNTIYGYEKQKFKGFGEYNNDILKEHEVLINEIVELTKKEFPTVDNYFIWLMAVDYVMEELGLKKDDLNIGKEQYDKFLNERNNLIYESVQLNNKDLEVK